MPRAQIQPVVATIIPGVTFHLFHPVAFTEHAKDENNRTHVNMELVSIGGEIYLLFNRDRFFGADTKITTFCRGRNHVAGNVCKVTEKTKTSLNEQMFLVKVCSIGDNKHLYIDSSFTIGNPDQIVKSLYLSKGFIDYIGKHSELYNGYKKEFNSLTPEQKMAIFIDSIVPNILQCDVQSISKNPILANRDKVLKILIYLCIVKNNGTIFCHILDTIKDISPKLVIDYVWDNSFLCDPNDKDKNLITLLSTYGRFDFLKYLIKTYKDHLQFDNINDSYIYIFNLMFEENEMNTKSDLSDLIQNLIKIVNVLNQMNGIVNPDNSFLLEGIIGGLMRYHFIRNFLNKDEEGIIDALNEGVLSKIQKNIIFIMSHEKYRNIISQNDLYIICDVFLKTNFTENYFRVFLDFIYATGESIRGNSNLYGLLMLKAIRNRLIFSKMDAINKDEKEKILEFVDLLEGTAEDTPIDKVFKSNYSRYVKHLLDSNKESEIYYLCDNESTFISLNFDKLISFLKNRVNHKNDLFYKLTLALSEFVIEKKDDKEFFQLFNYQDFSKSFYEACENVVKNGIQLEFIYKFIRSLVRLLSIGVDTVDVDYYLKKLSEVIIEVLGLCVRFNFTSIPPVYSELTKFRGNLELSKLNTLPRNKRMAKYNDSDGNKFIKLSEPIEPFTPYQPFTPSIDNNSPILESILNSTPNQYGSPYFFTTPPIPCISEENLKNYKIENKKQ